MGTPHSQQPQRLCDGIRGRREGGGFSSELDLKLMACTWLEESICGSGLSVYSFMGKLEPKFLTISGGSGTKTHGK